MGPKPFKPPTRVSQPSSNTSRPNIPDRTTNAAAGQALRENPIFRGLTSSMESLSDDGTRPENDNKKRDKGKARAAPSNALESDEDDDEEMLNTMNELSSPPVVVTAASFKGKEPARGSAAGRGRATARSASSTRSSTGERGVNRGAKRARVVDTDDEASDEAELNAEDDHQAGDAPDPANASAPLEAEPSYIPRNLLSRLIHDSFEHADTRINVDAMTLLHHYIDLFAKEAVMRAVLVREEKDGQKGGFLSVEDLEVLAPQLLLDFAGY